MTTRTLPSLVSLNDSGVVTPLQLAALRQVPLCSHCRVRPVPPGTTRQRVRSVPSAFFT